MQQHEGFSSNDLAELFRQKISLSPYMNNSSSHASQPLVTEVQELVQEEETPAINYSISQHYHHSAHVVEAINADQASVAHVVGFPQTGLSIYQTLAQHNITPSSLLRSQLTLFEQADDDQRSRLIQLWSISPSNYTTNEGQELVDRFAEYQTRTLEQEEESACFRHQRSALKEQYHDESESGDIQSGRTLFEGDDHNGAEAYITSGYELLAQRDYNQQQKRTIRTNLSPTVGLILGDLYNHATDPVYDRNGQQPEDLGKQPTEHQYGMFDQINRFQAQPQHIVTIHETEDVEML